MKEKLLLHICCAVCASRVIEKLSEIYEILGFFYNPNIEPPDEYQKRLETTKVLSRSYHFEFIEGVYETHIWHQAVIGLEHWAEGGERCKKCFRLRLEESAKLTAEKSLRYFATTLTVNPYKDANFIDEWGRYYAKLYNIEYVPIFLTNHERYNLNIAKKLDLYRQKYCGCIYSAHL